MVKLLERAISEVFVYGILNIYTSKIYVGSTKLGVKRFNGHKRSLQNNKHINKYLQFAWNKYGKESFDFLILENCNLEDRKEREQWWLNLLDASNKDFGYNIKKSVLPGVPEPEHSKFMSDYWSQISEEKRSNQLSGFGPRWEDFEYREKMLPISINKFNEINERRKIDPEFDKKCRSGIDTYNARPDIGEINSKKKKKAWENPDYALAHSVMMIDIWQRPGFSENHSQKIIDDWNRPGVRESRTEEIRKRWTDPIYRANTIRKRKETLDKKKTSDNDIVLTGLKDPDK